MHFKLAVQVYSKSIFSSAQYVTLEIFLTSKFSYNLLDFPNPPIKLKLGLQIGGRLLIATHRDQSNYLANQQLVLGFAVPFTILSKLHKNAGTKPFCFRSQTGIFWLFFIQL
jgi:hypothetical protein